MKNFLLYIFIIGVGLSSCISLNTSGYESLNRSEREKIVKTVLPIESLGFDGKIYQVTPEQVKGYIQNHKDVVVYEYIPFCKSENCISPKVAEEWCLTHGLQLCLVSTTYDYLSLIQGISVPVLAIDIERYNTSNYQKYGRMFYDELTGIPEKERPIGLFHLFRNGSYATTYSSIYDIK